MVIFYVLTTNVWSTYEEAAPLRTRGTSITKIAALNQEGVAGMMTDVLRNLPATRAWYPLEPEEAQAWCLAAGRLRIIG